MRVGGAVTPNLRQVLISGNDADRQLLLDVLGIAGRPYADPEEPTDDAAAGALAFTDAAADQGGLAALGGGSTDGGAGANIVLEGAAGAVAGRGRLQTGGGFGNAGEVLTAQGDGTFLWEAIQGG